MRGQRIALRCRVRVHVGLREQQPRTSVAALCRDEGCRAASLPEVDQQGLEEKIAVPAWLAARGEERGGRVCLHKTLAPIGRATRSGSRAPGGDLRGRRRRDVLLDNLHLTDGIELHAEQFGEGCGLGDEGGRASARRRGTFKSGRRRRGPSPWAVDGVHSVKLYKNRRCPPRATRVICARWPRRRARSADDQPFRRGARRLLHRIDTTRGHTKADHTARRDPHQSTRCERGARCAQRLLRRDSLAAGKPLYAARGDAEISACQTARNLSSHACAAHAASRGASEFAEGAAADAAREAEIEQSRSVASSSEQPAEVEPSSQEPSRLRPRPQVRSRR